MNLDSRPSSSAVAVIVTYNPTGDIEGRAARVLGEVSHLIIVDNGSTDEARSRLNWATQQSTVTLVYNAANRGIASALNQGLRIAAEMGAVWVLTMDQDSVVGEGSVAAQFDSLRQSHDPERVAGIGASISEERPLAKREFWLRPVARGWWFEYVYCDRDLPDVTHLITSGTLLRVAAWSDSGGFDEGLFIDCVDFDFCLRARRRGWRFIVSEKAHLLHNLGAREARVFLGRVVAPTHHSATRCYYMARNRVFVYARYLGYLPGWVVADAYLFGRHLLRIALFETQRRRKFAAVLQGVCHGLVGKKGPRPT